MVLRDGSLPNIQIRKLNSAISADNSNLGAKGKNIMRTNRSTQLTLLLMALITLACVSAGTPEPPSLDGRWDLTVSIDGHQYPSWLEVRHSGFNTLVGYFVGTVGSARPISEVKVESNTFSFTIPPQWESGDGDLSVQGTIGEGGLEGSIVYPDGKKYTWSGKRAPALRGSKEVTWGKPVALIQSNSLKGWHALGENQWVVEQGVLRSPKSGANLVTDEKFGDFKLHVEFRYPEGSNSGIYLRGRYEVQIADSKGKEPLFGELGGVYGFIAPSEQVAKSPGEWQEYDITLVGRMITVVANGVPIITNQEIPGITGGALDSAEGEPGPLLLQGDHGPIEYRNITITPATP